MLGRQRYVLLMKAKKGKLYHKVDHWSKQGFGSHP